jgi:transcriptional regulator with XRE-family HTH domain
MRNEERQGDTEQRNAIDALIGARIRLRRSARGLSQEKLGEALGLSYQQVQKYEKGQHRVSASRLSQIAGVLGVSVSYFLDHGMASASPDDEETGMVQCRETLEVIRAYHQIGDAGVRRRVVELMRSMGQAAA